MKVKIPDEIAKGMQAEDLEALKAVLEQDPRPAYQDDPEREYAFEFGQKHICFKVKEGILTVTCIEQKRRSCEQVN